MVSNGQFGVLLLEGGGEDMGLVNQIGDNRRNNERGLGNKQEPRSGEIPSQWLEIQAKDF